MSEHFELFDLYKAVFAIIAGLILGFEREMKEKSAGLKTITVICLGSTLFSILSYKFAGEHGDPTRIASYIVGGIGFLGAGVIFKQGLNVHGLTTAGIIWITSAIGMAIGFGEISMAFIFLILALAVIYSAQYISDHFLPQHHNKVLKIKFADEDFGGAKKRILEELSKICKEMSEIGLHKEGAEVQVTLDIHIDNKKIVKLEEYLSENTKIESFSYH
ncbi:MgtC/SapB family protein [Chryseobacterium suipulveris]|uniref:MgtC/SapB family protein n=1 Tax=Chryseobacterium suipulveris TaxID=2929800 RepID=A0ABY4BMA8_9FLAO|nr:MgtC/SapB family protein [Chryseobacterium suipulveris]UOE40245.1 MgtC/SapB family protein [Chryseobacterium suipulveris]